MKKLINKELVIGISVIVAIVVLIFGIEYLKGINMLSPANYYYVNYVNVNGLEVSSPVSINGFKVGQVREIKYDYAHPGKIKVMIAVNKELRIPEDSEALLSSTLMGSGFIDIKLGQGGKMLPVGGEIAAMEGKGLMDALSQDMAPSITKVLARVDSLVYNLNLLVADPSLSRSIGRFDGITSDVLSVTHGLNTTVNRDLPFVMRDARSITTKIDSVSTNLSALSYNLKMLPLNNTVENVNKITENLEQFSKQLNDPNSSLGMLTNDPELYNRINKVAADVDSLIVDIKKNPKRYISIKLL